MKNILYVCLAQVMIVCPTFCAAGKPAFTLEIIAPDNSIHEVIYVATMNPDLPLENFAVEFTKSVSAEIKKAVEVEAAHFLLSLSMGKKKAFEVTGIRMHPKVALSSALEGFNKKLASLLKDPSDVSEYVHIEEGVYGDLFITFVKKASEESLPTEFDSCEVRNSDVSFIRPSGNKVVVERARPAPQKTKEFE